MDLIPKKKQPFVNKDDIVESNSVTLRGELVKELKEMGLISMHEIRNRENIREIRHVLGSLYMHDFLYSQIHRLEEFKLVRTFYVTEKFKEYVDTNRENEIQ